MNIKEKAPHLLDLAWWKKSAKILSSEQVINGIEFLLTHIKGLEVENKTSRGDAIQWKMNYETAIGKWEKSGKEIIKLRAENKRLREENKVCKCKKVTWKSKDALSKDTHEK